MFLLAASTTEFHLKLKYKRLEFGVGVGEKYKRKNLFVDELLCSNPSKNIRVIVH